MKRNLLFTAATVLAGSLFAADPTPKDDILAAAKNLGEKPNYSWKTTVVVPEGSPFRPGPTEGKTEKDGVTYLTMSFGDITTRAYLKNDKGAVTNPDGGWQTLADLDNAEGPGRFLGMMLRNLKAPATQAAEIAGFAKDLKQEADTYVSDLTEEGAKTLLRFRRGGDGPTISNPKGSVKFWLKEGALQKYEYKVKGLINFGGNEVDVDRATTVEIKDVGTTKFDVPEEAKKKLQ
jgi:hypothetical protein